MEPAIVTAHPKLHPHSRDQAPAPPRPSSELVAELTGLLGAPVAAKVARILLALAEGSSVEDACVMADIALPDFTSLSASHGLVARNVERSRLKYKERLLKAVRHEDRTMDGKTAMWLLERAFPEEYGPNARKPDESVSRRRDVMREAFDFIRANPRPLVNPDAGLPSAPAVRADHGPTEEQAAAARARLEMVMSNRLPA